MPLNPSMNKLHQLVFEEPDDITKYTRLSKNDHIYISVDESDALGLTPLMIAAMTTNRIAIEKLIKSNCNVYICPLTVIK
jgi:hypothetical protein